ncbi:hypothetical protein SERLA73DRAFT_185689 [Serpula lacrymans var. lacrymans S7.3]|uniref:DUF6534 domain-containing protein n=2 Tax=Serpula lacrymans var. lacrymans TaxID=341189 RepID=F8Q689_SERL3|nr:uncharacterized protein SERLADRAFT_474340 [Serpula lacrymans var. lacrymans S7.9]EGN96127.1 hypothetical protein SERLA73DRAFT_185689 [Serpula lacrymans var. lacrymans S7.3]EGO21663.1 hypothetical protein SERLADRAFT_474340 [Serpula lacrymans var. lacrymans S7.9]
MNVFSPDLGPTLGALFIAFIISTLLYGVTSAQTFIFFKRGAHNGRNYKAIVTVLWILHTLHFIFISHSTHYYAVTSHGNFDALGTPIWSLFAQMLPTILTVGVVQYVWTMRIWTLSNSPRRTPVAISMCLLVLLDVVFTIVWFIKHINESTWADIHHDWIIFCSFSLVAFNDILATFLLCVTLHRSKNGIRETDNLISTLMAYALNTGLLTSLVSIAMIILIFLTPLQLYYIALYIIIGGLYANALLALLNWKTLQARRAWKRRGMSRLQSRDSVFELSTIPWELSRPPSSMFVSSISGEQ